MAVNRLVVAQTHGVFCLTLLVIGEFGLFFPIRYGNGILQEKREIEGDIGVGSVGGGW